MVTKYISPGVYVIEKDISQFAPVINSSVVGLVGFASKGPINVATLITSPQRLIEIFGEPSEDITGQALEGALEILETTNQIYLVRASDASIAANASATVDFGACPAIQVSSNTLGVTQPIHLKIQVTDNAGVDQFTTVKTFNIPSGTVGSTGTQGQALKKVIGGELDESKVGAFFDGDTDTSAFIVGAFAGSGATLSVTAYDTTALTTGLSALVPITSDGDASGVQTADLMSSTLIVTGFTLSAADTSGFTYQVQSLHPGAGYNAGTKPNGDTSGNSIEIQGLGGPFVNLVVNQNGTAKENFKVSLIDNKDFFEDQINTGSTENLKSDIIQGSIFFSGTDAATVTQLSNFVDRAKTLGLPLVVVNGDVGANPRFVKPLAQTINMTGGNNGIATTETARATSLIGDAASEPKTGMQALDEDILNISVACVPGISTTSVQNALVTLAAATQAFLAIMSTPFGIGTVQDAINWTNGQSETRTAALNSSYAAVYWPWVQTFSTFDGKDRWYDPAIFAVRQMMFTDAVADPWFAAAGFVRGRLTKPSAVEVKLNQGDKDALYSGGNIINPIMNFPQQGITIFGNRTAQRAPTALDRVNVRRLMIQVRKVILASTLQFAFEPNDEILWDQIEGQLNPFLDNIKRRRGITQFSVICDETTNTPARVDRNELWCKVVIKPTKTAEILIFEMNITNQSAQVGEG